MSTFREAWIRGDSAAVALVPREFDSPADRAAHVKRAASRTVADVVRDELIAQNGSLAASLERNRALRVIRDGRFAAVVTGQQVGLLGGPLYAAHKAASAIVLARQLEAETGIPVVPIFWLQTEDHDLDEIAATVVVDARGAAHALRAELSAPSMRAPVAYATLPADTDTLRMRADSALRALPHGVEATALAEAGLDPAAPVAAVFVALMSRLFSDTPLLFFSPRSTPIAKLAAPLHAWALRESEAIDAALTATAAALGDAGFSPQVPPRAGCALSFVQLEGPTGARQRPQRAGEVWQIPGTDWKGTTNALLAMLESDPLRFSTSALLRPLVQDTLLPTAAWIGGPAELAYMAQIGPLYRAAGVEQPLVVARRHLRWLPPPVQTAVGALACRPDDLLVPIEQIAARLGPGDSPGPEPAALRQRLLDPIQSTLEELRGELAWADGLDKALDRTSEAIGTAVERLVERLERARVVQQAPRLEPFRAARRWLEVDGVAQERVVNALSMVGWYGREGFVKRLLAHADPLQTDRAEVY